MTSEDELHKHLLNLIKMVEGMSSENRQAFLVKFTAELGIKPLNHPINHMEQGVDPAHISFEE